MSSPNYKDDATLKIFVDVKKQLDQLALEIQNLDKSNIEKTHDVKNQMKELSSRFDKTFGSLEEVIDNVKKRNEQGETSPYG